MSRSDDFTMTINGIPVPASSVAFQDLNRGIIPMVTPPDRFSAEVTTEISLDKFDEIVALFGVDQRAPAMRLGIASASATDNRRLRRHLARKSTRNRGRRSSLPVDLNRIPVRVEPDSTVEKLEMTVTLGEDR